MSQAQFTVPLVFQSDGNTIFASEAMAELTNIATNLNPTGIGGYQDSLAQKQLQEDPAAGLAASLAKDIEQLRFALKRAIGETYWYTAPDTDLSLALFSGKAGDVVLGDGTKTTTDPLLTLNSDTGDAGIRLQVNNTSANAWDVYNDNSGNDRLSFDYNGVNKFYFRPDNDDIVFRGTSSPTLHIISETVDAAEDAALILRVNDNGANQWRVQLDNSDSDKLTLSYGALGVGYSFGAIADDPITFQADNIATSSTPAANGLYPHSMVKAWCKFRPDGTTTPVLSDRFNVNTLTVSGVTGTVTFHTAMADADYTITWGNAYMVAPIASYLLYVPAVVSQTTTGFTFVVFQMADTGDTITRTNIETLDFGSPATDSSLCFHVIGRQ